jgi:hypothetical protein
MNRIKLEMYKIFLIIGLAIFTIGCFESPPEMPGNLANPKLVELINREIAAEIRQIDPEKNSGWARDARRNTEQWMADITEVVARCRYGKSNENKFNQIELDIFTRSGNSLKDVYTGQRCFYRMTVPLVMRVKFENGRAIEAFTDGRELKGSIDLVRYEISQFAEHTVKADRSRNRDKYLASEKSRNEIDDEWRSKRP